MRRLPRIGRGLPRRRFLAGVAGIVATMTMNSDIALAARGTPMADGADQVVTPPPAMQGRLLARPSAPAETVSPGLHRLSLRPDSDRDAVLYVPDDYDPEPPAPFVLSLHGAGSDAAGGLYPLGDLADEYGLILLAPASRRRTWDMVLGGFGPDVTAIDLALAAAFARCAVDPARLAVAGFSDGASYALSLGVTNGDLFPQILAFSPGFIAPRELHGDPRVFISHGTRDGVLPIDVTSRPLVQLFTRAGYDLEYREFDDGHTVPPAIAREAVDWFLTSTAVSE